MSCVYEVISSLKYIMKVKLNPNIYPNILSEIIGLHENEGRGGNLAQIWAKILLVMDTFATCFVIFRHNPERYKHKLFMSDRVYTWTP